MNMGIYFNPGNESFKKDTRNEIYIDKTGLLEILNGKIGTSKNCIALSHARRFGKSQAAGMIDAYYSRGSDSEELFSNFEIARKDDFKEHLNKYNVIHLDISSFSDYYEDNLVKKIEESVIKELKKEYANIDYSESFGNILAQISLESKSQFVIIIDEWDCIIRNQPEKPDAVHKYLQFLHSLFKSEESKTFLALAYITGVLPIKKIKDESAMNNFREYTMLDSDELTPYFGFTDEEVSQLCSQYGMNIESVREWYDGYIISGMHMYNPNSVYEAMTRHKLDSYWKNTSHFEVINDYITLNFGGLKEDIIRTLTGERVFVDTGKFKNDLSEINSKDDALTALIHLGYLGYDPERKTAFIPNYEVSTLVRQKIPMRY